MVPDRMDSENCFSNAFYHNTIRMMNDTGRCSPYPDGTQSPNKPEEGNAQLQHNCTSKEYISIPVI